MTDSDFRFYFILVIAPATILLSRWIFFHLGKFIFLGAIDILKERSKLRHQLIEIQHRNNDMREIYILIGFLFVWVLIILLAFFI